MVARRERAIVSCCEEMSFELMAEIKSKSDEDWRIVRGILLCYWSG